METMKISWLFSVPLGLTIASSVWAEDLPGVNRLFSDHMVGSKTGKEPVKEVSDGKLRRFAIAAKDGSAPTGLKWFWADAVIDGDSVVVSCPEVQRPVAVHYAYHGNPSGCNLYNKHGLPASPFRTED